MKLSHVPLRAATGIFLINSGLSKRGAPPERAASLQAMATDAVPQVEQLEPTTFVNLLSLGELALGASLLTPFVPSWLAGLGLTAFSLGTLRLYLNVEGMRQEGSLRPTQQGTGIAKDVWMLGIGLALFIDDLRDRE